MMTDIEIAQSSALLPITEIAKKLGVRDDELELYGKYKAKITDSFIRRNSDKPDGKLILVTAISPTPAGEGKTTTTVGLGQAMEKIGKKAEELKKAREDLAQAKADAQAAAEKAEKAEDEAAALRAELDKARKSAAAMDNKVLAEFAVLFRQAQETVNRMTEIVDELDEESRPKIYRALGALRDMIAEKAGEGA